MAVNHKSVTHLWRDCEKSDGRSFCLTKSSMNTLPFPVSLIGHICFHFKSVKKNSHLHTYARYALRSARVMINSSIVRLIASTIYQPISRTKGLGFPKPLKRPKTRAKHEIIDKPASWLRAGVIRVDVPAARHKYANGVTTRSTTSSIHGSETHHSFGWAGSWLSSFVSFNLAFVNRGNGAR